jgi:hypothetical protein
MAERLTVDQQAVGSSPIRHPVERSANKGIQMLKSSEAKSKQYLMTFNAFGSVKASANEVIVSITAITEKGKPISRVFLQEHDEPLEGIFKQGEFVTATFGVTIAEKGLNKLLFNDEIFVEGVDRVSDVPGVNQAIMKTVDMVKQALDW